MTHIAGALLIALGCCWLGEGKARKLRDRERALNAVISALEQMSREMTLCLTPLPQLMERIGLQSPSPARELLLGCGQAMERLPQEPFSYIWKKQARKITCLNEQDIQALEPLGEVLGRYGAEAQADGIHAVAETLRAHHAGAMDDSRRLGRVYRAVGAAGGGALIIPLL